MILVDCARAQNGPETAESLGSVKIDRFAALALDAVERFVPALQNVPPDRVGIYVGNVFAGWTYGEPQLANLVSEGPAAVHAYQATAWFPAAAQGQITIAKNWTGIAKTFSGSRCAFAEALLGAAMSLSLNRVDAVCVGMAEATTSPFIQRGAALLDEAVGEESFFILIGREGKLKGQLVDIDLLEQAATSTPSEIGWAAFLDHTFGDMLNGLAISVDLPFSINHTLQVKTVR